MTRDKGSVGFYTDFVWTTLGFTDSTASYRNPIAGLKLSATTNTALTYTMTIVEVLEHVDAVLHEAGHTHNLPYLIPLDDAQPQV